MAAAPREPGIYEMTLEVGSELDSSTGGGMEAATSASLLAAVVPMYDGGNEPFCTATYITDDLLLTAAHCVNPGYNFRLTLIGEWLQFRNMACLDSCGNDPFRHRSLDIGTLVVSSIPSIASASLPGVGHWERDEFPDMILLGYRGTSAELRPRAVCGATIVRSVATVADVDNLVQQGDSGGPLVGVVKGKPYILGVVSGGLLDGQTRYFAPIPPSLELPPFRSDPQPANFADPSLFATIPACHH